jgi:Fe-S cluster biogenesis protein NfuA
MKEKVEAVLNQLRPMLQADGGNIELVEVKDDGTVLVRLQGACHCCPSASVTLKQGVERLLREQVPEVKEVVNVQ